MPKPLPVKPRDPRLDFFRGIALLIIFIAHFQGGWLWDYIPARFGLSDAADLFVFCSGYAAAIAFGGTFLRRGFWLGTARIVLRCWHLYVAHLALFVTAVAVCIALTGTGEASYLHVLGLQTLFADAPTALFGLATLRFVPNYFDILPLYIVVLAMVPIAMLMARISPTVAIGAAISLYAASWWFNLRLPADQLLGRSWYFNPLCWQLIFFTGFALSRGWIKAPLNSRFATWASLIVVLVCFATSLPSLIEHIAPIGAIAHFLQRHADKTDLDLLRFAHFLATAQLAVVALKGKETLLLGGYCRPIVQCGQQALSVFLSGMVLSHVCSMLLIRVGDGLAIQLLLNGVAISGLIGISYCVAWFKSAPWVGGRPPLPTHPLPGPLPVLVAEMRHGAL